MKQQQPIWTWIKWQAAVFLNTNHCQPKQWDIDTTFRYFLCSLFLVNGTCLPLSHSPSSYSITHRTPQAVSKALPVISFRIHSMTFTGPVRQHSNSPIMVMRIISYNLIFLSRCLLPILHVQAAKQKWVTRVFVNAFITGQACFWLWSRAIAL